MKHPLLSHGIHKPGFDPTAKVECSRENIFCAWFEGYRIRPLLERWRFLSPIVVDMSDRVARRGTCRTRSHSCTCLLDPFTQLYGKSIAGASRSSC